MSIVAEISRFVASAHPTTARFDELALLAFRYQFDRIEPFRALCTRLGKSPDSVASWREVPLVAARAFASTALATDPPVETFRSSGTTGGVGGVGGLGGAGGPGDGRSVHHHPFPELYRAVIDATFPRFCLPAGGRPPILSLVPSREVVPDSSLGFLAAHVIATYGAPESAYGIGPRGVELGACRSWLAARQREKRPAFLLTTVLALADLLERIERLNLHFRLAPGSAIFETGGSKGRAKTIERDELLVKAATWLGVPPVAVVSEFGMTELTSHAYTTALAGGDPTLFVPPASLRVRALDPVTLEELPTGVSGVLTFFDLANVGSALHVLSEDLGRVEPGGFRLDGRAPDAELRGCSLTAEELAR